MRRAGILAIALMLIAATVGTAAGAAWGKVYYQKPYGQIVFKPKRIDLSDLTLTKLRWRHWGTKIARAHGRARGNDCIPNCASGTIRHGTATLRVFRKKTIGNKRVYTCLKGTTKLGGQKQPFLYPPEC
jgi:hypothetical protein